MRHTLPLLSALLMAVPASAQLAGRDLRILFNPGGHYVSPFYSGRPSSGAPFVFFEEEPIQVLIRFANWSDETLMLRAGGRSPGEAVSVRLYRISESGPVEVPVRLNIDGETSLTGASQESVLRWEDAMPIPARWSVTIPVLVQTPRLEPGAHELRVNQVLVSCEPGCGVRNHAGVFDFDFRRADDLPKELDQLLRRAVLAIEAGNFAEADRPISRILELHPSASAAYQLLGRRAELLENWNEAADAYERSAELVATGRDTLLRHPKPQEFIGPLRARAAEVRACQGKC